MRKGFSATTFVLVAVLVGALFMVGKTVIPPPPGPPEPPPTQQAQSGDPMVVKKNMASAQDRANRMKQMMQHEKDQRSHIPKPTHRPKFDPTQIEITPRWTDQRLQGDEGNKDMAIKVMKAKAIMEAERKAKEQNSTPAAKATP